jgi:hypothetical protein
MTEAISAKKPNLDDYDNMEYRGGSADEGGHGSDGKGEGGGVPGRSHIEREERFARLLRIMGVR